MFRRPTNNIYFFNQQTNNVIYDDKQLREVYRVQFAPQLFNLASFLLGINSLKQSKFPTIEDVVHHQKCATYIGTTDNKDMAIDIAKKRLSNKNIILTIDPNFLELINVNETVHNRTDYFIDEKEFATLLLPIAAIKKIEFNQCRPLDNPFYILPTRENIRQYKELYEKHRHFLIMIFEQGKEIPAEKRREAFVNLIISHANFYEGETKTNPFRTKIGTLTDRDLGHPFFRLFLSGLRLDKTIEEFSISPDGYQIIQKDPHFNKLHNRQEFYRLLSIDDPYGSRSSYAKL
jgi:hypothetical protein